MIDIQCLCRVPQQSDREGIPRAGVGRPGVELMAPVRCWGVHGQQLWQETGAEQLGQEMATDGNRRGPRWWKAMKRMVGR
jgi:hypothetical protein